MSAASRELKKPIARIPRDRVPADTVRLARFLLGKVLVREIRGTMSVGRIVETEAYLLRALEPLHGIEQMQRNAGGLKPTHLQSVRIGITKAANERLRYYIAGSRHLSGPRKLNAPEEA